MAEPRLFSPGGTTQRHIHGEAKDMFTYVASTTCGMCQIENHDVPNARVKNACNPCQPILFRPSGPTRVVVRNSHRGLTAPGWGIVDPFGYSNSMR